MSISKELVAASATPLVLSILAEGDNYGYAIIKRVGHLSGGKLPWTDGMLYPVLHRLEKQKLIESYQQTATSGRKRKYYKLKKMESAIKNFMYAGVGLASLTAEKLQKSIDKLIEENKISTGEGKKILDEFFKKTENKKKEFEKQLKKITEEVVNKVQLPKKKDIESLEKRIAALEAKVGKLSKSRTNSKEPKTVSKV